MAMPTPPVCTAVRSVSNGARSRSPGVTLSLTVSFSLQLHIPKYYRSVVLVSRSERQRSCRCLGLIPFARPSSIAPRALLRADP